MLKACFVACLLLVALPRVTFAACSPDDAAKKASDIAEVLSDKLQSKPDEASKMMSEMGTITGDGTVTEQTCVKLDDLMMRAKKL